MNKEVRYRPLGL